MRIDMKVIAGLAAAALAVFVVAPDLWVTALPLLLLAACPLMMVVMMKMMMPGHAAGQDQGATPTQQEEIQRLRSEIDELRRQPGATDQALPRHAPDAV